MELQPTKLIFTKVKAFYITQASQRCLLRKLLKCYSLGEMLNLRSSTMMITLCLFMEMFLIMILENAEVILEASCDDTIALSVTSDQVQNISC